MAHNKVELQVVNISSNPAATGTFILLLCEINGRRQLPITIGSCEAQALIIELRGIIPQRPLTFTLFAAVLGVLGVKLLRVLIYKVENGVFYSYLYLKTEEAIIRVDARTSDAIALATQMHASIFVYEEILDNQHLWMEHATTIPASEDDSSDDEFMQQRARDYLQKALQRAIDEENYERAAELRDQIKQLKND